MARPFAGRQFFYPKQSGLAWGTSNLKIGCWLVTAFRLCNTNLLLWHRLESLCHRFKNLFRQSLMSLGPPVKHKVVGRLRARRCHKLMVRRTHPTRNR